MMKTEMLAVSVVIARDDCYLLVERAREPGRGQFAFPGGRVEPGEPLESAARREVLEETGLTVGKLTLVGEYHIAAGHGGFHLHVFSAESFEGLAKAGDDAASVGWYDLARIAALPMPPSMHDMLAKLGRKQ